MSRADTIDLHYTGAFSLAESVALATRAAFVDPMREGPDGPVLEVAFPVEETEGAVAVSVRQVDDCLRAEVLANQGGVATEKVRAQLERTLSLEPDGDAFVRIIARDQVLNALQQQRPGVRPVLFPSPYQAAARAIIGQRLHVRQAATIAARIAAEHGVALDACGRTLHAFPTAKRLADLSPIQGLSERKVNQLRALGAAAADGLLDTRLLRAMEREAAMAHLQRLGGIGPFSAELILIRGVGDPDAFPKTEMRLQRAMAEAYGLGPDPDSAKLEQIAEGWRPYRSWVGLLLRNR